VYGSSYGNSAKAKKDQTKSPVDNLKGPKDKEMKEAAKPDFLDMDKDGNKKEPMKKAIADKSMKEELKGNQDRIDANHNNKIDGQDFKILRGKKKVKEGREFTEKLLETVRKSDVPAYLRKAKGDTPLTMADVKAPKKDSISAPENLAKARNEEVERIDELKMKPVSKPITSYGGKPSPYAKPPVDKRPGKSSDDTDMVRKEEVEHINENDLSAIAKKHGMEYTKTTYGAGMSHPTKGKISINRYGEWNHFPAGSKSSHGHGDGGTDNFASLDKHLSSLKEGSYEPSDAPITTDTLAGRMPGGKSNSFKSFKTRVRPLDKEGNHKPEDDTPKIIQPQETSARKSHEVKEATIAGTSGWEPMKKDVKDKSGAVHTPMSRAKDLARQAFKTVQNKTKVK
jgi:hypothetical protein